MPVQVERGVVQVDYVHCEDAMPTERKVVIFDSAGAVEKILPVSETMRLAEHDGVHDIFRAAG